MIAVPRVFERIYGRLMEQLVTKSPLERRLFHAAVATGWRRFEYAQGRRGWNPALLAWPLFKRLVADQLGARLGVTILQGYGLTETSPVVSVNTPEDNDPASVGLVLGGTEIRVGDRDELLVRGPGVMLGYWNNHAATAAMIDADGWLHTGDKVRVERGHIYITGRIKDILVLSNGEKVPPGDMELAISLDPLFEQVLVVGEGRPYLSALLVLNNQLWPSLAQEYGLDPDAPASLADPRLVAEMQTRVRAALQGFPGYAKIRRLALLREPWTVDNDLLTATLKIKRARVLDKHQALVEQLYAEGPA
jgi:long-chain acyl-CoA synthetase